MNEEKLKTCFAEALGIPFDNINDSLTYQGTKQWDSVAHMALIASLENEFNIMLETDQILAINSVKAAREILCQVGIIFP